MILLYLGQLCISLFFFLYGFYFHLHYSIAKKHLFVSFCLFSPSEAMHLKEFPLSLPILLNCAHPLNPTGSFKLYILWNLFLVIQCSHLPSYFFRIFRFRVYLMFVGHSKLPLALPFISFPLVFTDSLGLLFLTMKACGGAKVGWVHDNHDISQPRERRLWQKTEDFNYHLSHLRQKKHRHKILEEAHVVGPSNGGEYR